ncbi:DoxX family protein [Halorientalis pallida]|uniref:DoxX family protein n=1 Tax=Halorientalis pallida TaxID=2479928 RepID=A0A498KX99_9EURY|nr:DoxX family protein [Halorientalis pallida]RXK46651.1 DoxX family protein [Halorientalis pallida]
MVFDTVGAGVALLLARVLFGAVLAFMGLTHLLNGEEMVPYAEFKGIPFPGLAVPFSGGLLLFGGLAIALGAYPVVGAGALAAFLLVATPTMHDFWAAAEADQQDEMINFLKNVAMLAGALVFLALGSVEWPYAVGVGLV